MMPKKYLDLDMSEQRRVKRYAKEHDTHVNGAYTLLVKEGLESWEADNVDPDERDDAVLSHEERAEAASQ